MYFFHFKGLKPGQRKVLFTCFKRNDKREVKVAQLAGSVAEMSSYHHGEVNTQSIQSIMFLESIIAIIPAKSFSKHIVRVLGDMNTGSSIVEDNLVKSGKICQTINMLTFGLTNLFLKIIFQ